MNKCECCAREHENSCCSNKQPYSMFKHLCTQRQSCLVLSLLLVFTITKNLCLTRVPNPTQVPSVVDQTIANGTSAAANTTSSLRHILPGALTLSGSLGLQLSLPSEARFPVCVYPSFVPSHPSCISSTEVIPSTFEDILSHVIHTLLFTPVLLMDSTPGMGM